MLLGLFILFAVTLAGIAVGCAVFSYEISWARKLAAAGIFAVLNVVPIPIPIVSLLLPPVAMYVALMDDRYQRGQVNRVFVLAFVFAIASVVIVGQISM